jgi:hypothetical protein
MPQSRILPPPSTLLPFSILSSKRILIFARFVEHYANRYDFVSLFGVLEFISPNRTKSEVNPMSSTPPETASSRMTSAAVPPEEMMNRFSGRVFERAHHGGHMFVQHYLTNMFGSNKAEFLAQEMDLDLREGRAGTRIGLRGKMGAKREGMEGTGIANGTGGRGKRVGDVSRLVGYLGGGSPGRDENMMSKELVLGEVGE